MKLLWARPCMVASLPDDLLLEILFHLKDAPVNLFRCAAACKRWRALVAEPAFHRRCWPDQDASSSLAGFFTAHAAFSHLPTPCFTPTPRSVFGPGRRALTSFITSDPCGVFDRAMPLVSRHGLLLVRPDTNVMHGSLNSIILDLAVCNLLIGVWHMLPALKFDSVVGDRKWNSYALLTECRHFSYKHPPLVRNSSFFKVAIIGSDEDGKRYILYTFSSRKVGWSTSIGCLIIGVRTHRMAFSDVMVRRGMAHWLRSGFYLVTLNIQSGHLSCTKIRVPHIDHLKDRPWLTLAIDESLALLWMRNFGPRLEILAQQQNVGGNSEWLCTSTIELKQAGDKETMKKGLCILGENCVLLLVKDSRQHVYTTKLETGTMEEVVDWPRRYGFIPCESFPLELNWPAFFSSRLGIRYIFSHSKT
ncbi:unnamed protein product [Alopecurus aequalis]